MSSASIPSWRTYLSGDPPSSRTNIPTYGKVAYSGIYHGVDLSFYGNADHLEYDFSTSHRAATPRRSASPATVNFGTQIVGVSTIKQGLTQPTALLENQGTEAVSISSIEVTPSNIFAATNNCNGSVAAGGNCTHPRRRREDGWGTRALGAIASL